MSDDGSSTHTNRTTIPGHPHDETLAGTVGQWSYKAPAGGAQGVTLTETLDNGDTNTYELPGVAGRYVRNNRLTYLVRTAWGTVTSAPAEDVVEGKAWAGIGYPEVRKIWGRGQNDAAACWLKVANSYPVAPLSPPVTVALPPQLPVTIGAMDPDRAAAIRVWAGYSEKLTPIARWVMGALLLSPWTREAGSTSTVLSLWGKAGEGKSLAASVGSALFGPATDRGNGLFTNFNSSAQGLTSRAQELSYLPIILDEVASQTGEIEKLLVALVQGANRTRATRDGGSAASAGRWDGVILTTSNDPLPLRHEMFARRLLSIEATDLWQDVPSDDLARREYWQDVSWSLDRAAGWPWADLTRQFPPGPTARDLLLRVEQSPVPKVGADSSLVGLARLGMTGARWLAAWTGEDRWSEDVPEAVARLLIGSREEAPDAVRDAARAILTARATNPGAWNADEQAREVLGWHTFWQIPDCAVRHGGECDWLDVIADRWPDIVPYSAQRLSRTRFGQAFYSPEAERLTRKVRKDGNRSRVLTLCLAAVGTMAETEAVEVQMAYPEPALDIAPPLPIAEPEQATEPEPEDPAAERDTRRRRFGHSDEADLGKALDAARAEGLTDLVGPQTWRRHPENTDGWASRGWTGNGSGRMVAHDDDAAWIRVWPIPTGHTTPERYAAALREFVDYTGYTDLTTVPTLAHRIVMEKSEKSRAPRWKLPAEQAKVWTTGEVLHSRQWGTRADSEGARQYDRRRSYLPAMEQARLAPLWRGESYEHYGPDAPTGDRTLAGMYRIVVPETPEGHVLPMPHGNTEAGSVLWASAEIVDLYADLGLDTPEIREAWLAPKHDVTPVLGLAKMVRHWLDHFGDRPGADVAKAIYQSFAGSITSEHFRSSRHRVYRPDWGNAIADNSWASVVRTAYRAHRSDPRFVPVRVNVDALYYPPGLGTPPEMKMSGNPGHFREEG